jgi:hypothetical protein
MSGLAAAVPAIAAGSAGMATVINPIEVFFNTLNTNPFFIGVMMLLLNLGGRFLGMEISKNQERVMQQPWIRRFFIFTVLFVATRNVLVALFLTIIVLIFLAYLLNENSDFYLGPKVAAETAQPSPGLTVEETEILRRLTEKQQRMAKATETEGGKDSQGKGPEIPVEEIYTENLVALQNAA